MKTSDAVVAALAFGAVLAGWWWWKKRKPNAANPDPTNPTAADPQYFADGSWGPYG